MAGKREGGRGGGSEGERVREGGGEREGRRGSERIGERLRAD